MGFEIIDGYAGKAHITQEQVGDCNIGTYGPENYVLPTGRKLEYEIITNNKIRVYDGSFLIQGRRCHLQANTYVDFVVENGSQGEKRYDILAAKYVKDSVSKVESIECVTYKGTPSSGTPDDPDVDTGDIRAGESPIAFPLYRVIIDGINVTAVEPLFETLVKISDIMGFIRTYSEIMSCTKTGFIPDTLAVKNGFEQKVDKSKVLTAAEWAAAISERGFLADAKDIKDYFEKMNTNITNNYTPYTFSIYGAILNGYCSNALLISDNQFHDCNKPMLVSKLETQNLPSDCELGSRFVFIHDVNNLEVVIIGRGTGASQTQNIWINYYIKSKGWLGWTSLR